MYKKVFYFSTPTFRNVSLTINHTAQLVAFDQLHNFELPLKIEILFQGYMDPTAIFWFIYSFYLATFIWNFYLTLRQYNVYRKTETRPEKVSGIISNEDFVKARNYNLDKMHFGFYEIAFGKSLSTVSFFN